MWESSSESSPPPSPPLSPSRTQAALCEKQQEQEQQQQNLKNGGININNNDSNDGLATGPNSPSKLFEVEGDSFINQFEDVKNSLIDLTKQGGSLPNEYAHCATRAQALILDIERCRQNMNHLGSHQLYQYLLSVVVNEVNDVLHSLHDIAEDRAIRGESLTDHEVQYITEMNELYQFMINDILPALQAASTNTSDLSGLEMLNLSGGGISDSFATAGSTSPTSLVIALNTDKEEVRRNNRFRNKANETKALEAIMSDQVEITPAIQKILDELTPTEEELTTIKYMFLRRSSESLKKSGIVVKTRKLSRKLRYLFLTNYQLIYTEAMYIMKGSIDLATVKKSVYLKNNLFHVIVDSRVYIFFSYEAKEWVDAINDAVEKLMNFSVDTDISNAEFLRSSTESPAELECEVEVCVKECEDLKVNPKGRPDNPYFVLGVGNPEHYGQDRRMRKRCSNCNENTRSPKFDDTFTLKIKHSKEHVLDIRFYSKLKASNHFSYGVLHLPLNKLLEEPSSPEHRKGVIEGWFDIETDKGNQGRVHLTILLKHKPRMWHMSPSMPYMPAICAHKTFQLRDKVPLVFGGPACETVGIIQVSGTTNALIDPTSRKKIYTLEKSTFLKKEYRILDENGVFAKCFHKMKSIRKKKIRMFLTNNEWLFTIEGGCFNNKQYDNEVFIKNSVGVTVATILFGGDGSNGSKGAGKQLFVNIVENSVDRPLIIIFALYVLRTWSN